MDTTERDTAAQGGEQGAWRDDAAVMRVYHRLLRMARLRLDTDAMRAVLGTESLVHETIVKLKQQRSLADADEEMLVAAASRLMGQTLIDLARRWRAEKRGGGEAPATLRSGDLLGGEGGGVGGAVGAMEFGEALDELGRVHPDGARIIEMRFWGDLSLDEIARVRGTTRREVTGHFNFAKAWLARELNGKEAGDEGAGPGADEKGV